MRLEPPIDRGCGSRRENRWIQGWVLGSMIRPSSRTVLRTETVDGLKQGHREGQNKPRKSSREARTPDVSARTMETSAPSRLKHPAVPADAVLRLTQRIARTYCRFRDHSCSPRRAPLNTSAILSSILTTSTS